MSFMPETHFVILRLHCYGARINDPPADNGLRNYSYFAMPSII